MVLSEQFGEINQISSEWKIKVIDTVRICAYADRETIGIYCYVI